MKYRPRIRRDVVARFTAMLPPCPPRYSGDTDPRFAPPGEPARTDLGRYCDRVRAERRPRVNIDPAQVVVPDEWELQGRWLAIEGVRAHTEHPTRIVIDLDDPQARLALVAVAAVLTRRELHPFAA